VKIVPHLDIHGAVICFTVVDEQTKGRRAGRATNGEVDRVISEADAELALLVAEALKEDHRRFPPDDLAA
jgi:hypothetical protein